MLDVSTPNALREAMQQYGSWAEISRQSGVHVTTLKYRGKAWGVRSQAARATTHRSLANADYNNAVNGIILPPRADKPVRSVPKGRKASRQKPLLIALPADQHCPHQDPGLESCWLAWVEANQPDRISLLGDLMNLSKPSRHRANLHERHNDTPEECFAEGHAWLRRTIQAAGDDCRVDLIAGNHDLRVQIAALERIPEAYNLKRPGEEYPWWDLEYMLGLDRLGVEYHRPEGEYHSVELALAESFSVAHGAASGPYGGAPRDAARHEGSRAVGHSHKGSIVVVVRYRDGQAIQHVHVSVPTMARRDLGYQPTPDTVQGFATLTQHHDGTWNAELALYDDRRKQLWWRDQTYTAD